MVKYDPVLGAFRTIDNGSQNGNTDTIFAGSGLLMCINETGFLTNWSPNFTINTKLSDVLFSVMQRFDNDEFYNSTAHLDFIRRLDALENGNSGGAANITVNGIAPDEDGNIKLTARWIPMPEVTENGETIIQSSVCGSQDLEQFYERMQGAVFNIDGNAVRTEEDYDGYHYTGEVDLKYYVESPDWSWIVQHIAWEHGDGEVDMEQHYYLHTQIHEMLDKYSAYCVNGYGAGEYNKGEIWLDAGRIPYTRDGNPDDSNGVESIMDHVEAIDYSAFFYPDYYGMTNVDTETGNPYTVGVTYMAPSNGWLIIEWCSYDMRDDSYVEIDGKQFQLGTVNEKGGSTYRQFIFPIAAWSNWFISDDECRSYTIRFLPCVQLFSTGE